MGNKKSKVTPIDSSLTDGNDSGNKSKVTPIDSSLTDGNDSGNKSIVSPIESSLDTDDYDSDNKTNILITTKYKRQLIFIDLIDTYEKSIYINNYDDHDINFLNNLKSRNEPYFNKYTDINELYKIITNIICSNIELPKNLDEILNHNYMLHRFNTTDDNFIIEYCDILHKYFIDEI
jgi:hypothetical protein